MSIGIMPGGFNLLHAGHLAALEYAKQYCDYLIVVVVRDQSIRGHKLIQEPIEDRYLKLRAIKWVDEVIPCESEEHLLELLKLLNYDYYFLSEEYKDSFEEGKKIIGEDNLVYTPRKHNWSTTNEVEKIVRLYTKNKSPNLRDKRRKTKT